MLHAGKKKRRTRAADKRRKASLDDALRAWDLRNQGLSLRQIAKQMNLSGPQQARNILERGYTAFYLPGVEQRRAESEERMRRLFATFMPISENKRLEVSDRVAAASIVIKADRELRQLRGDNAPEQAVQLTAELPSKDVRQELLDRLARLAESSAASEGGREPERG